MFLQATAIPTGGVIGVKYTTATSGTVLLARAVSGSGGLGAFTPLLSGSPVSNTGAFCYFLDIGDQTPGPLVSGVSYVYQLTDVTGTMQSPPVQPNANVLIDTTQWTKIIIAILQGAINAAVLPTGVSRARVFNAMPLAGNPPLPLIAVNPELEVQSNIPVGADDPIVGALVQPATSNNWIQAGMERRMFRITAIALSAEERDFWRKFIIGTLRIATAYALSEIAADYIRDYQASSYQVSKETSSQLPAWYAVDVLWDITVESNVTVITNYNYIETITAAVSGYLDNLNITFTGEVPATSSDVIFGTPVLTEVQVPIVSG
jgi:hypothetical protein